MCGKAPSTSITTNLWFMVQREYKTMTEAVASESTTNNISLVVSGQHRDSLAYQVELLKDVSHCSCVIFLGPLHASNLNSRL